MFGYIKADKPELKIKEFEAYKAVYCTLCKKLGKNYGFISRLTLSYDFTFLAMLNMSLKDGCPVYEQKRCAFNPLKKCNYCKEAEDLEMPCAAAMILLYYKILDNISDEKGFKKLGFKILKPIFSGAHKKASKAYPQIEEWVKEYIETQNKLEKRNCDSLDMAADPSALMLSKLFTLCSSDQKQKRVLERLGYCLGRYIYILDAVNDLPKDIKTGNYNVFKNTQENETFDKAKAQLYFCISEAAKAFELLEIKKYETILGNIIYLGLERNLEELKNERSV
ncbi:MAG: hypothetical protein IJN15_01985 [Clostridia bacterium]|nr:hypothetical protein [Clostridia bacterium]